MDKIDAKLSKMHMGRMIHILSCQMKRNRLVEEMDYNDELTSMQKHVLKHILLETIHKDVYQKDIEEEFQIRKPTVSGILKLMEKNGFIYRESVPSDARLKRIIPTKKAEALRPDILAHIQKREAILTEGISEEDIAICKRVMCRMFQNLTEENKKDREVGKKGR